MLRGGVPCETVRVTPSEGDVVKTQIARREWGSAELELVRQEFADRTLVLISQVDRIGYMVGSMCSAC